MKVSKFLKKTLCLGLSAAMLLGTTSPVTATAHEHETAAEIVTEIMDATIESAETVIDKQGLLDAADATDTKNALTDADSKFAETMGNLGTAVENAEAAIDALDGKVTKDNAKVINAALSEAYNEAAGAHADAVAAVDKALVDLETANEAYESAKQISDDAAKLAEAELKTSQNALNAAVEAAKLANQKMTDLKNEFAKATELASKWNAEVEEALLVATENLAAANEALNNALAAIETEDAELKAAIDEFKRCYEAFIEAANVFYESIQTAMAAQKKLDGLYTEYEAAQAVYAEALAVYEAKCAEYAEAGYPADYETLKSETERLSEELDAANDALVDAQEDFAAKEKTYKFYEERVSYLEALQEKNNIITSETATEEEKAEAAYNTAEIIVEQFIVAENIENNVWSEDTQIIKVPAEGSVYGKSDYPFFVVIGQNAVARNVDNTFVIRYGYEINEETSAVEIFELVPVDTTNFIEYNGVEYELEDDNDELYIVVNGSKIDIYKGGTRYYEKITLDGQFVEDVTEVPTKVNVAGIIDVEVDEVPDWAISLVKNISWVDLRYNEEGKYHYAFVGVELGGLSWGYEFPIDLVQNPETGAYTAEYNYEVDIYSETCSNEYHLLANDHSNRVCINTTHTANGHHGEEGTVCRNPLHILGKDDKGNCIVYDESICVNKAHTDENHAEYGPCKNQYHIDNGVCAQFLEGCQNPNHTLDEDENCIMYDESVCDNGTHIKNGNCAKEGTTCITQAHIDNKDCTRYKVVCANSTHVGHDSFGFARKYSKWIGEYTDYSENCLEDFGKCTYDQYGECEPKYLGDCEKGIDYGKCDKTHYGKCEPKNLGECAYDQYGECDKVWAWGCTYDVIGTEARVLENVPCKYPETKPQAEYKDAWYDVVDNKIVIDESTTINFTESEAGKTYTYQVNVKFIEGGDENTFWARKVSRSESLYEDLASLIQKKAEALAAYELAQTALEEAEEAQADTQVIYDDYSAKLNELEPVYIAYKNAETVAVEKELGELAELPKNISEMVEGFEPEEMVTLLEVIVELSSQGDDIDYEAVLKVLADVVDAEAAARLVWVFGYDAVEDGIGSILPFGLFDDFGGFGDIFEDLEDVVGGIIDELTPPTEFEREYANAWVDALMTKIKVVQNAVKLVEAATVTVEAGVAAVTEGIELADVAVEAVLATAEKEILEATVDVLAMATEILGTSEEVVTAIDNVIAKAQAKTEAAYFVAVAEKNALNQVVLPIAYGEELAEILETIGTATALSNDLAADIQLAEELLATAKALNEELKALEEHEHNYVSEKIDATCTEAGCVINTCAICTDTYTEELKATGHCAEAGASEKVHSVCKDCGKVISEIHNFVNVEVTTEATCTSEGEAVYTCECDYVKTVTIPKIAHDYETDYTVDKEATCTEVGSKSKHCDRCDATKDAEVIPATGHSYESKVTEPTCTAAGYTTHTCTKCDDSYVTDEIAATGHNYESKVTAPTCTTEGYTTHTCKCGNTITDTIVNALGHSFGDWKVTKPATETECGEQVRYCTVAGCDGKDVEAIEKLVHTHTYGEGVVTAATCTTGGYTTYTCTAENCGHVEVTNKVAALGHNHVTTETAATCETAGYFTHVCSRCNDTYTTTGAKATGHAFGEWAVTTPAEENKAGVATRTCHCGATETQTIPALGHSYTAVVTAPTCTTEGYTTYTCECGDSYAADKVPALGHKEASVVTPAKCTTGGYTTYTCTVCGISRTTDATNALGHDYVPTVTAATCEAGGYTTYTCSRCNDSYTADVTAALGHSYGEWTVTKEATEEAEGEQVRICATCGDKDTQAIAKKEHVHVYVTSVVTEPTCTEKGYTTHTCKCGETTIDTYVDALGHAWTEWTTIKEATKEEAGQRVRECERCEATETESVEFVPTLVTSITLDRTEASLKKGAALQLIATVLPEEATDATVTWSTSDETIATVSEDGVVKAVKAGKVEITATANDGSGVSVTCEITVKNPVVVTPNIPEVEETPEVQEEIPIAEETLVEEVPEEEIVEEEEDLVVIEDEETPLADGAEVESTEELVEIEDEETPLASGVDGNNNGSNIGFIVAAATGVGVVGTGAAVAATQAGILGTAGAATAASAAAEAGSKSIAKTILAFFKKLFKK